MLSIICMNKETAPCSENVQRSQMYSLVANLSSEFPGTPTYAIRVAIFQAEHDLWPKKDAYLLLDHARDILRGVPA